MPRPKWSEKVRLVCFRPRGTDGIACGDTNLRVVSSAYPYLSASTGFKLAAWREG
jgi:hypothetical protein